MSGEGAIFADMAGRLFQEHCGQSTVEAAEAGRFPAALWTAIEQAGILDMLLPEEKGGTGAGFPEALAVLRVAGAFVAPGPIVETVVVRSLLADAGIADPGGPLGLAFAGGPGAEGGLRTAWPHSVSAIAVVDPEQGWLALAPAPAAIGDRLDDLCGEPLAALKAGAGDGGRVEIGARAERALQVAALLRAFQILGALEWCVGHSIAYGKEREQFGQPIGRFQLVQNHLSEMAGHLAAASVITTAAANAGTENPVPIAACRARLADAIDAVVAASHQVHGAIGFSREHGLNFRTRRLLQWRDAFGNTPSWRRRLASAVAGRESGEVWAALIEATGRSA